LRDDQEAPAVRDEDLSQVNQQMGYALFPNYGEALAGIGNSQGNCYYRT
jgi:hypothetical protein